MAQGRSDGLDLPYPLAEDYVNVHGDIRQLVEKLEIILPPLGVSYFQLQVSNNSGQDISAGDPLVASGFMTKTNVRKALATDTEPILGLAKTDIPDETDGVIVVAGVMDGINTSGFTTGDILYVGETGGLTATRPAAGSGAVGLVAHAATEGVIIVEAKGNGTWGALKAGLA
jgi:hypothetical protein